MQLKNANKLSQVAAMKSLQQNSKLWALEHVNAGLEMNEIAYRLLRGWTRGRHLLKRVQGFAQLSLQRTYVYDVYDNGRIWYD